MLRWWDGSEWTEHSAPIPAPAGPMRSEQPVSLDEEETTGRWAQLALACAIPIQFLLWIGYREWFADLLERLDEADSGDTVSAFSGGDAGSLVLQQVSQLLLLAVGVVFLFWFYRAAVNARAMGLPTRREPPLATAGFVIPIVNLWWPYQSTRDLLPAGDPARPHVLRWFLLWMVGGFVSTGIVLVSALVDGPLALLILVVPVAQVTLAAVAARRVISDVLDAHQALAGGAAP
jgi:hypothetical protein